jgi:hypothetical protein
LSHQSLWLKNILIEQPNITTQNQTFNFEPEDKKFHRGAWTQTEDEQLKIGVEKYGMNKWSHCASLVPTRSAKQCRDRYCNHLRPNLNKDLFEEWEDELIIKQHKIQGNRWSVIASMLHNRSPNSVKNRWYSKLSSSPSHIQ